MKPTHNKSLTGRREALKILGMGSAALAAGGLINVSAAPNVSNESMQKPPAGLPPVKIKSVKAIGVKSNPEGRGSNLIVVKVETTEPGLYGLGCATFTQRAEVVVSAINNYMSEFCVGRDADNIDVTNDVREFALLSVPMKNLCKDDCKGLCSKCGTDLNISKCTCSKEEIDPRWKPLMELKDKLNLN